MLRLRPNAESRWIDLPYGVRVLCRPLTTAAQIAAENRAARSLRDRRAALPEGAERDEDVELGLTVQAKAEILARELVEAWQGVTGDDDTPAPVTPDNAAALMRQDYGIAVAFLAGIREPLAPVVAEGNG